MAELDPGLQQEAADASVDFCVAWDSDAPLTRDQAFIAGFKTAAGPRDQRIAELEEHLRMVWSEVDELRLEASHHG